MSWNIKLIKAEGSCRFGWLLSHFTVLTCCKCKNSCFKLYFKAEYMFQICLEGETYVGSFHTVELFSATWAEECSWGHGDAHCPPHPPPPETQNPSWTEGNFDWALETELVVTLVTAGHQGNHSLWVVQMKDRKTAEKMMNVLRKLIQFLTMIPYQMEH